MRCCEGVEYAHQRLIVHRDLKPSNLLVTQDGHPKLLDFGIAKILDPGAVEGFSDGGTPLTQTHQRLFTPEYAAPEQLRGEAVTTAADTWALGVLLYELLTGRRPFQAATSSALERAICESQPMPASRRLRTVDEESSDQTSGVDVWTGTWTWSGLRGDLDTILSKAMRKEAGARYSSVAAMADDVRRFLDRRPITARPATVTYRVRKLVRRNPVATVAVAGSLLAVSGLMLALWRQVEVAERERDLAALEARRAVLVSDFAVGLFKASDPNQSRGDDPRASDLVEAGVARIDSLDENPYVQARMLTLLGDVYATLERHAEARDLIERAVERLEVVGPDGVRSSSGAVDPFLSDALGQLAQVERALRNHDVAASVFERALDAAGTEHPDRAWAAWLGLAITSSEAEKHALALRQFENAIATYPEQTQKKQAMLLSQYGEAARAAGQMQRSIEILEQALVASRAAYGDSHPETARAADFVGTALVELEQYERAEPLLREAAEILERAFGREHSRYASAAWSLGALARRTGRYAEAVGWYERCVQAYRGAHGPDDISVGVALAQLSYAHTFTGDFEAAIETGERSVRIAKEFEGDDLGGRTAAAQKNLGFAYLRAGQTAKAESVLRGSIELYRKVTGTLNTYAADPIGFLGVLLLQQNRSEEARELFERGFAIETEALGPDHSSTLMHEFWLGEATRRREGQSDRAASQELFDRLATLLPSGHHFIAWGQASLLQ